MASYPNDVVVVGGGGHVGLPLSLMFASRNLRVGILDTNEQTISRINAGVMPFWEPGAQDLLAASIQAGRLFATADSAAVASAPIVVVVIGTPVDEHLNPDPNELSRALEPCRPFLHDGQLLVLRSTVFPGVTNRTEDLMKDWGLDIDVAFAPERVSEHNALKEIVELPQIVSGSTESAVKRATELFEHFTRDIVVLTPKEAELAKLFTNAWRYMKFAVANQFFMIAQENGLDYSKIRSAITHNYPRAADLAGAGFAAGPCLFKDTMQLSAFSGNQFYLGHSAMMVNEGLPGFIVTSLEKRFDLIDLKVGVLGMSFKAGSDDVRSSLSYKLKRILRFKSKEVLCTDPMVSAEIDPTLVSLEQVLQESDVLILGSPHVEYLSLRPAQPYIDVWGLAEAGELP